MTFVPLSVATSEVSVGSFVIPAVLRVVSGRSAAADNILLCTCF